MELMVIFLAGALIITAALYKKPAKQPVPVKVDDENYLQKRR